VSIALTNGILYTGDDFLIDHAVVIRGERITAVVPNREVQREVDWIDLGGRSVAPGFVDLQVNGGGDVLFNDDPTGPAIEGIAAAHRRYGTTDLMPTYVTGPLDGMAQATEAVAACARDRHLPGVLGIHFEGPAINPAKTGAHDRDWARADGWDELLSVYATAAARVRTLVTLAPEVVPRGFIADLARRGVRVSAGHTDATSEELAEAITEGLTGGTHLWNAMSSMTSRAPGAVGALLADDRVWCSVIADGHHVDFTTLAVTFRAKPRGKAFLVSDAMPPLGGSTNQFHLGVRAATARDGRCVTADGTLAGSVTDLAAAVRNCVRHVGVAPDEALRMASLYPAQYLGVDDRLGRIRPGFSARFAIFDDDFNVSAVVVDGVLYPT